MWPIISNAWLTLALIADARVDVPIVLFSYLNPLIAGGPDVLQRARRDIRERRDVYGHDLLAWALYRTGKVGEAKREMQLAQSQHTEDVMLASHAAALATAVVR